jgi:O-antigen/teichoic acid export membrane protein
MIKNIASTFVHKFLIVIANFLLVILTSQKLGSEGRGETSLFVTDFAIILLFTGIVAGSAMSYFTPKKDILTISTIGYLWSIPVSILGVFVLHFIHPTAYYIWLFGAVLIQSFTTVHQMVMVGKNSLLAYNLSTAIQPIFNLAYVFFYFEILDTKSVSVFVEGYVFSSVIAYIISVFQTAKYYSKSALTNIKKTANEMITFGSGSYFSTIVQTITYRVSYYVLFWFGFSNAVGELSNGIALTEATWMISNSLSLVLYANILNTNDENEQRKLTLRFSKICFILTFFSLTILLLVPANVFVWLFGKDFSELKIYILLLSPGVLFMAVSTIIAHYFAGKGNYAINNIKSIIGFTTVLIGLFLFIPFFGKKGAALASSISYILTSLYLFYYYFKISRISLREIFILSDFKEIYTKTKNQF